MLNERKKPCTKCDAKKGHYDGYEARYRKRFTDEVVNGVVLICKACKKPSRFLWFNKD